MDHKSREVWAGMRLSGDEIGILAKAVGIAVLDIYQFSATEREQLRSVGDKVIRAMWDMKCGNGH